VAELVWTDWGKAKATATGDLIRKQLRAELRGAENRCRPRRG
jgi:hypothetical protein